MNIKTIYSRFARWVKLQPDAIAVVEDGRSATYRELDEMADAIITKFGHQPYRAIGLVMSHGIEVTAAMLAILKNGSAYLPAEHSLPRSASGI